MPDDQQPAVDSLSEPYYEPIGPGSGMAFKPEMDDDGGGRRTSAIRAAVLAGVAGWLVGLRSRRFWMVALGAMCATWAAVAGLVLLPGPAGDTTDWLPVPGLVYLLASLLLPATAALTAMHWGMSAYSRAATGDFPGSRILSSTLTAALQGLVLALLILLTLLLQARAADQPGTVAAVSAGVAAVEGTIFGGMGAAVAALGRHRIRTRAAGWALALFLVAGTVAAGAVLLPAVRVAEPVTVALNVQRAPDGTLLAYDCSAISAGISEVYRTERMMWLPAASPSVVFVMLAGQPGAGAELFGWLSAALQEAADGTQVPCIGGEPRSRDMPRMPMAAAGLLVQAAVAGVLLGWAQRVASRRRALQ